MTAPQTRPDVLLSRWHNLWACLQSARRRGNLDAVTALGSDLVRLHSQMRAGYRRWQRRQRAQDNRAAQEAKAARKAARQEINAGNEGLKLVPVGTQIFLERQPDGSWQGALFAEGILVEHNRADHRGLLHRWSVLWRKERFARSPRIVGG